MSTENAVRIAVLGVGGVGKCFLSQLEWLARRRPELSLALCYVGTSTRALYEDEDADGETKGPFAVPVAGGAMSPDAIAAALAGPSSRPALELVELVDRLSLGPAAARTRILVDNTSSQAVADLYPRILAGGINIVTPNKKAFSGPYDLWQNIARVAADPKAGRVFHESSCGAGLPVISTLKDLIDTGDDVLRIEGVFSGTMSFLFNSFAPASSLSSPAAAGGEGPKWSAEVARANTLGYTEPDPRDDLNGLDVARKLTILARMVGLPVQSPTSFPVQSLIPKELESAATGDEFMARLPEFDAQMEAVRAEAAAEGKVVRFVGSIDVPAGDVKVGLQRFEPTHPIAALKGSDNIISLYTRRYGSNPLIIQGAGAGGEVTAMGVMSDLLKVLQAL